MHGQADHVCEARTAVFVREAPDLNAAKVSQAISQGLKLGQFDQISLFRGACLEPCDGKEKHLEADCKTCDATEDLLQSPVGCCFNMVI